MLALNSISIYLCGDKSYLYFIYFYRKMKTLLYRNHIKPTSISILLLAVLGSTINYVA